MVVKALSKIHALAENVAIGAAGIIGVDQVDGIVPSVEVINGVAASASSGPDWVEPLLQGLIAIFTIIATWFRSRPKRDK